MLYKSHLIKLIFVQQITSEGLGVLQITSEGLGVLQITFEVLSVV